jgi:hypothetical protein
MDKIPKEDLPKMTPDQLAAYEAYHKSLEGMSEDDIKAQQMKQMHMMKKHLEMKMNKTDNEEMEDWLDKIDNANKLIDDLTTGKITAEEFDRKANGEKRQQEREAKIKKMKLEEAFEKKKKGRSGKGHKENYQSWCRLCSWEYEIITPVCLRCGKETIH